MTSVNERWTLGSRLRVTNGERLYESPAVTSSPTPAPLPVPTLVAHALWRCGVRPALASVKYDLVAKFADTVLDDARHSGAHVIAVK
jgi:hypothetical protein